MRRFGDFSRGWGIGEETYEFWSWMARQYVPSCAILHITYVTIPNLRHRILAELLEQGTRTTLTIPSHRPPPVSTVAAAPVNGTQSSRNALETDSLRSLGLNPSHALQHPGFYYYMAAKCTEKRRERFLGLSETEASVHDILLFDIRTN